MKWELEIASSAKREMRRLSDNQLRRINQKILKLVLNPFPQGTVRLKDGNGYRIRVGNWRILYDVYTEERRIVIYAVGHRSRVYKNL